MKKGWYYDEYLRSEHWQKTREIALENAGHKCSNPECGWKYGLNVHHLNYNNLYRETEVDLKVLCRGCHEEEHNIVVKIGYIKKPCICCGKIREFELGKPQYNYCWKCKKMDRVEQETICLCRFKKPKNSCLCFLCTQTVRIGGLGKYLSLYQERKEERDKRKKHTANKPTRLQIEKEREHRLLMELNPVYAKQFQTRDISYNLLEESEFIKTLSLEAGWKKMTSDELRLESENYIKYIVNQNKKCRTLLRKLKKKCFLFESVFY